MLTKYAIGTTTFAALCSIVWLILGGSFVSALLLYVVAGQACMLSLIILAAIRAGYFNKTSTS